MELDQTEFQRQARHLANISDKLCDHWTLRNVDQDCFLVKKTSKSDSVFEYHIVYDVAYRAPVLYFNIYHVNGVFKKGDEIRELIPATAVFSQKCHPILQTPFWMVHQCNTNSVMKELSVGNYYLISWLSVIGQTVGLEVGIDYFGKENELK